MTEEGFVLKSTDNLGESVIGSPVGVGSLAGKLGAHFSPARRQLLRRVVLLDQLL